MSPGPGCVLWSAFFLPPGAVQATPADALRDALHLHQAGQTEPARRRLDQWCAERPADPLPWIESARLLLQWGEAGAACERAERGLRLDEGSLEAHRVLGSSLLLAHREAEAQQHLERAVARFPDDAMLHFLWGMACAERQDFKGARQALSRSLELDPDNAITRFWAGDNEARLGNRDAAERHLRHALQSPQENPDASWKLASVLAEAGRDAEAEQLFRAGLGAGTERSRLRSAFHLGVFLLERQHEQEAEPHLEQVCRRWPEHAMAWYYLARCRRRLGKEEQAREAHRTYQTLQRDAEREETRLLLESIGALR